MIHDLKTKLDAYAEGRLDPEATMEIDGLITRYLDDQLDPETAANIVAAIDANQALAAIVADNAEGKQWLDEQCLPAMRDAEIEMPAKLRQSIEAMIADPEAWGKEPKNSDEKTVVPFETPAKINRPPWWLLAASISTLLFISGIVFVDLQQDREEQAARIDEMTGVSSRQAELIENLTTDLRDGETALGIAEQTLAERERSLSMATERAERLAAEQAILERQLAVEIDNLTGELSAAREARRLVESDLMTASESLESERTKLKDLEGELSSIETDAAAALDQARVRELALAEEIETLEGQLGETRLARAAAEADLVRAKQAVAGLEDERQALTDRIAALAETDRDARALQGDLARTEEELASLSKRTGWLNQIAGYHRGYAGSMREVEFQAEQIGPLLTWLSRSLDRAVTVPDLTEYGLRFIGGRLFFVNGTPVAQIAYHDHLGRLTAFCFMPNRSGQEQSPSQSQNGDDLHLIDWKDKAYQYVLICFDSFDKLQPAADDLAKTYRHET